MRHIKMRYMVVVAIFLTLVLLSYANGKPRPLAGPQDCFDDPTTWKDCPGGPVSCFCCYDDGCWICGDDGSGKWGCDWDPKYRAETVTQLETPIISPGSGHIPIKRPNITLIQNGSTSISPGRGKVPLKPPNGAVLQAGPLNISSESAQSPIKPPSVPSIPSGPTTGRPSTSYTYSTSATDPNGEQVTYTFDWGDGTSPSTTSLVNSGAKASLSHKWARTGTYLVKAMATNGKGATSAWSSTLSVEISTAGYAPVSRAGQGQNNNQKNKDKKGWIQS